jgi:cell division protein FtsB
VIHDALCDAKRRLVVQAAEIERLEAEIERLEAEIERLQAELQEAVAILADIEQVGLDHKFLED